MAKGRRALSAEHQELQLKHEWERGYESGKLEGYYEAGHKEGWREGFDVGHHDGYVQGYDDATAGRPSQHTAEPHPSQAELSMVPPAGEEAGDEHP
jgi:flagellar biosynthesis/type III secretory pathway protein FliH